MRLSIKYCFLGAICFCAPGIVLTAILRRELNEWLYTVLPVVSVLCAYFVVSGSKNRVVASPSVAIYMLLGIHVLGAWFAMIEYTFLGGGFRALKLWPGRDLLSSLEVLLFLSLPLVSWIMLPLYFFALCFVTLFLIFAHFRWERGHGVLSRSHSNLISGAKSR